MKVICVLVGAISRVGGTVTLGVWAAAVSVSGFGKKGTAVGCACPPIKEQASEINKRIARIKVMGRMNFSLSLKHPSIMTHFCEFGCVHFFEPQRHRAHRDFLTLHFILFQPSAAISSWSSASRLPFSSESGKRTPVS